MSANRYTIDMCNGPLAPKILKFALPLMAASMLQLMFTLADVIVVGKFAGDLSQAAVTSTTPLINLLLGLFFGLSGGSNVVAARALGSGDQDEAQQVVHTSVLLGIVCGAALATVGIVAAPTLLTMMHSPENVIGLSTLYLRIYFLGLPATVLYNFASAILRANGDTRRPLYFLILAGVVNVVLNLILVIFFHMGVAGVAIATALSNWISVLLALRCLIREDGPLHLDLRSLSIHGKTLRQIIHIGIPAGIQSSLFSVSNVAIQSSINSLGDVVMAGSGAASSIENIGYAGMSAFFHASITFASQNYGARKPDRIDRSFLLCHLYSLLVALLLSFSILAAGPMLLRIFTDSPEVIAEGMTRLRIIATFMFIGGAMDVSAGTLRGLGWSILPMVVTLASVCGLRLVWIATVFQANPCPENVYVCYPITWIPATLIHVATFLFVRRKLRRDFARQDAE